MHIQFRDLQQGPVWLGCQGDAQAYYRMDVPARITGGRSVGALACATGTAPSPADLALDLSDCAVMRRVAAVPAPTISGAGTPTIIRFAGICLIGFHRLIAAWREAGVPVFLETDDDWTVFPDAAKGLGAVASRGAGVRGADDLDGVKEWRMQRLACRAAFIRAARAATGVVVSTPTLVELLRPYNTNVALLPNAIDPEDFAVVPRPADGPLRIGFAGGTLHYVDDLALALPGLIACARLPSVELHFFGSHPRHAEGPGCHQPGVYAWRGISYRYHPKMNYASYRSAIGILDVAVAPQVDTAFNRARSAAKWLEHAMHGTAMVVSDMPAYGPVEHGRTGLKARTAEEFAAHLLRLVGDADLRRRIGAAARAEVLRAHSITARAPAWRTFLSGVPAATCACAAARSLRARPRMGGP